MSTKKEDTKVIQWENPGSDDIIYRWHNDEIKWGTALVVREYEIAAFFRDGKLFDIFQPGRYILSTQNLPLLTRAYRAIMGYKETPFKADIIFLSQKIFQGKWGIRTMVKAMKDMESPMPLMANGSYQFRVKDPTIFLTQVVGGLKRYSSGELNGFLKGFFSEKIIQSLSNYYYMDVYQNLEDTSTKVMVNIEDDLNQRGIELLSLKIIDLDTEEQYKKDLYEFQRFRSSAGVEYRKFQTIDKMADAIGKSKGGASIGTGMLLFPQMYQQLSQPQQQTGQAPPPTRICPYCNTVIPANSKFCPNCGKDLTKPINQLSTIACPSCGANIPANSKFCPNCGKKI